MVKTSWSKALFAGVNFKNGRLFDTFDPDEGHRLLSEMFSDHRFRIVEAGYPLRIVMDHIPLGSFSLNRLRWHAPVHIDPYYLENYYLICIPISGHNEFRHGNTVLNIEPGDIAIAGGGERFHFTTSTNYDQVVIHIDRTYVDQAWTSLTGMPPEKPIVFFGKISNGDKAWRALCPILMSIAEYARGEWDAHYVKHLPDRLREMLVLSLLTNQPHTHRAADTPTTISGHRPQLLKLQGFLLDRLEEPTSLTQLSIATGTPIRTIQWIFKKEIGMGPMQWLREQRLLAIHQRLLDQHGVPPRITELALRFQLTHLGEFARHYRKYFGETPRETAKRNRS